MPVPTVLEVLSQRIDYDAPRLQKFRDYDEGKHRLQFASAKFKKAFGGLFSELADNWCETVIDAVEERLNVEGFRLGADDADADAWAIWQANGLDLESQIAHREALVSGRAYVSVWANAAGAPTIAVESPQQTIIQYAAGNRRVRTAALRKFVEYDGTARATLWLPDRIETYRSSGKVATLDVAIPDPQRTVLNSPVTWVPDGDVIANPLGVVPVVELTNRPRLLGDGRSEIQQVIPLQDSCNKIVSDMLVASDYSAFRQKWGTGIDIPTDPVTSEPVEPYDAAVTRVWLAEDEKARFGDFSATDLGNYVQAISMIVQHVASISRTPPHYIDPGADRLSGSSIQSAESGLIAKCYRKMRPFGEAWEEVVRLAFGVLGDDRATATSAETLWRSPEFRSDAEKADALVKLQTIGVPTEALWREWGASPQQVQEWRRMRRADALDAAPFRITGMVGSQS